MFWFFLIIALLCVGVNITISMLIVNELQKRKVPINWFLLRLYLPKYAHQYKKITLQETGKVGGLFYAWLISINATLVFGLIAVAMKIIGGAVR